MTLHDIASMPCDFACRALRLPSKLEISEKFISNMQSTRKLLVLSLFLTILPAGGTTLYQANFNSQPPDANNSTGTLSPSIGIGTITLLGGVTGNYGPASSAGGNASSDPTTTDDTALVLTGFPTQSTNNRRAGFQIALSTVGYRNLVLQFDSNSSASADRYLDLQVSTNGGTSFSEAGLFTTTTANNWATFSVNLSSISALNNNPSVVLKLVTEFQPSTGSYQGVSTTYNGGGSIKFDMVTIDADLIAPENPAWVLALSGLLDLVYFKRGARISGRFRFSEFL